MANALYPGDGVLSEAEFLKGCLEDADLVGFLFLSWGFVVLVKVFYASGYILEVIGNFA